MKKLYIFLAFIATTTIFAQAPQGFNYQATVRNSTGALIVNQNVNFKFNIMLNSATSLPVFSETHMAPTDDLGQVNLVIGTGTASTGSFTSINWGTGNYYLGIELNTGAGYIAMGTTQLLSVPYALYANSAGNAQTATPNLAAVLAVNNGANNLKITNLAEPTTAQDAATKNYVDNAYTGNTTLVDGSIFVGNASNTATAVALSGDVTISNTGVATITDNAVSTSNITDANITNSKLDKANIPLSGFGAATADVNLGSKKITNLANPINAQDAVTKDYLLSIISNLQNQINNLQNFENSTDNDVDGFNEINGDCNDSNININPNAYEIKDGVDNDCDGIIDEGYDGLSILQDFNGNSYNFAKYGLQFWTVENAKNVTYRDGTPIPQVTDPTQWASLTTGAWCYYDNNPNKGKLFNWYAVVGIHDAASAINPALRKQLAPTGWHVPSKDEWNTLKNYLIANGFNFDGTIIDNKIGKSMASTKSLWFNGGSAGPGQQTGINIIPNNKSGFNALPIGYRNKDNAYVGETTVAAFWSSTEWSFVNTAAWIYSLSSQLQELTENYFIGGSFNSSTDNMKRVGLSIRFVKD